MARKPIDEATAAEIRAFALERCELDIHANANKATAAQRLRATWSEDWIEVPDGAPAAEADTVDARPSPPAHTGEPGVDPEDPNAWYTIHIPLKQGGGIDQIVPVGVNGTIQLIKRGEKSEIRAPFLGVLKNSIEMQQFQEDPDDIRSELTTAYVEAYPFTIIDGPYLKDADGNRLAA